MIRKWRLSNFKSILNKEYLDIDLGRITVIAGTNSSGKSAFIQSILMISQTLRSEVGSRAIILNGPLVRLGRFEDIKTFGSRKRAISVGWECDWFTEEPGGRRLRESSLGPIDCDMEFDSKGTQIDKEMSTDQPSIISYNIAFKPTYSSTKTVPATSIKIRRRRKRTMPSRGTPENVTQADNEYTVKLDKRSMRQLEDLFITDCEISSCRLRHFVPVILEVKCGSAESILQSITMIIKEELLGSSRPRFELQVDMQLLQEDWYGALVGEEGNIATRRFPRQVSDIQIPSDLVRMILKEIGEISPEYSKKVQARLSGKRLESSESIPAQDFKNALSVRARKKLKEEIGNHLVSEEFESKLAEAVPSTLDNKDTETIPVRMPFTVARATRSIQRMFASSIRYLGPLREDPRPAYPIGTNLDPQDIGLKGEFTAAVLESNKMTRVSFIHPKYIKDISGLDINEINTMANLGDSIVAWLEYLDIAKSVSTGERGMFGTYLNVTTSGTPRPHSLAHVGVGVSQVLPILVMCLLAGRGTVLVVEQPELHLHPRVQARLADFFLTMGLLGKQCIIETHSEHLMNRFRLSIAADNEDKLGSLFKMYFVDKSDGESIFNELVVNEYGAIENWPKGFFDEAQAASSEIMLAATRKHKKRAGD